MTGTSVVSTSSVLRKQLIYTARWSMTLHNAFSDWVARDWLSIDWDTWHTPIDVEHELKKVFAFMNFKYGKDSFYILRRRSPRGGTHVLIKTRFMMKDTERFDLRSLFNDDKARLNWDMIRANGESLTNYSRGVLFDAKMIPYQGERLFTPGEWELYHA